MKKKVTPELLATCLDEIESGRMSLNDCLGAHPVEAEELRLLLEVAQAIPPISEVTLDPSFRRRGRATLLASISADRTPARISPFPRWWMRIFAGVAQPKLLVSRSVGMPALAVVMVIALATMAGGGAVYASQDALPGDALYQVKTAVEDLQVSLATGDQSKAQTYLNLTAKRLAEIEKASQKGNATAAAAAADAVVQYVDAIDQHLAHAAGEGEDITGISVRMADNLARQQAVLASAQKAVPEPAKAALDRAAEKAEAGLALARSYGQMNPLSTPPGSARKSPTLTSPTAEEPTTTPTESAAPIAFTATAVQPTATSVTLTQTISDVLNLASDPPGPGQSYDGLLAKLRAAQAAIERGQRGVAARILDGFQGELNALANSHHITSENYNTLYSDYGNLVRSLGGTPSRESTQVRRTPAIERKEATPEPMERPGHGDSKTTNRPTPSARSGEDEREPDRGRSGGRPTEVPTTSPPPGLERTPGPDRWTSRDPTPASIPTAEPPATPVPSAIPSARPMPSPRGQPFTPKERPSR